MVPSGSGIIHPMKTNHPLVKLNELAVAYAMALVAYNESNRKWNEPGADRSWLKQLREDREAMFDLQNQLNDEAELLAKEM